MTYKIDIDEVGWRRWVNSRPQVIQKMCKSHPPNRLYKMPSGHCCKIYSYDENGTMTVNVTGEYNLVAFARSVFGMKPEELVECDLPNDDELVGEFLNQDEAKIFLNKSEDNANE